ncbi:MAG: hypothetical protein Ct9H300mP28_03840 [Pseudomonadota bacterium]|nr:MAG: hypothetical protein Ct9H300mP28_03840 [Pseudomonadota bacterium]
MSINRQLLNLTAADFIVGPPTRWENPLLPSLLRLGSKRDFLGFIVSASTLTGMLLSHCSVFFQTFGGRGSGFLLGPAVFHSSFFLFMDRNPHQLLMLRFLHGTATAIYGQSLLPG